VIGGPVPAPVPVPVREFAVRLPSPVEVVVDERLSRRGVSLLLKRDDLIHPDLPGNKWRKLAPNLAAARDSGHDRILTFGGAYSNHLAATAAAGYYFGFETIGVVRGEEHLPLNEVLASAERFGMRLVYMDRATYREKHTASVFGHLREVFGDCYVLPEGGSNGLAVQGCSSLPGEISEPFDVVAVAVGTGGTLAGVAGGLGAGQRAVGVAVLKGGDFLRDDVAEYQASAFGRVSGNWGIETEFHFGGYAKRTGELDAFVEEFEERHSVRLSWVYEGKMMFGLYALVERGVFPEGTRIVAVLA
jgi:1-aminocyclopropane-1-carboxylate deaminase